ncbi:MAG: NAD(P)H-quinone oxidoreductase [Gemmatimonadota bacterium]|nr:NAD(P)H-quinone oxidoreductase [Gemmatimonadota bacterium]
MKAIRIREPGGPDVLELVEVPDPVAAPGEALVRVRAAGVNRADLLQRAGHYPAPPGSPADIPGLEFAGEVVAHGPDAGRPDEAFARESFPLGAPAMGIVGGGGYAELVTVPVEHLMTPPGGLSIVEAGAIPEVFLTACDALCTRGRLERGDRVLIHSAGGGVGSAALQLAAVAGAGGIAGTASSGKLDLIRERGLPLDLGVDYRAGDFAEVVEEWTGGRGVDVVLDTVGGPYWTSNVRSLAVLGRLVIVGVMGGSIVEVDLRELMKKRASVVGTVLRARPIEDKTAVRTLFTERFLPAFEAPEGQVATLTPILDTVISLEDAADAHRLMGENRSFGKIVLNTEV